MNTPAQAERTAYTTCPLCEATCGLAVTTRGREVTAIRGDAADVFSRGYLCPKGASLKELDADPDRIRLPLVRQGDSWHTVTWDAAFAHIEQGLAPIIRRYGRDAVAVYLGNPNVHNLAGSFYVPEFLRALGSRNLFSASTVDQMPKQVAVGLLFGTGLSVPIPDIERTDYLLVLGANPLVSNGSLMTAPDMRGRLRSLRQRGGRLVVIDPVRTRTADEADTHLFIRPGTDAFLLMAMVQTLFAAGLTRPGRLVEYVQDFTQLETVARPFTPEQVAAVCGIAPATIRRLAHELAAAERAVVYARIGTCTQEFGTLTSWLVDVLNILTGNLDRAGGALFPRAAVAARNATGTPGKGTGVRLGRWHSRVRGLPETYGELPVVCLAEEIETPGAGQVRALVTIGGNPALSTPNSGRLERALATLDFMVSVDLYRNETTRHANVILPALSPLEHPHYDVVFYQLAAHNVAHYSPPVFAPPAAARDEWQSVIQLADVVARAGKDGAPAAARSTTAQLDEAVVMRLIGREVRNADSPVEGRDPASLLAALAPRQGPERILDFLLRVGPYGDGFGARAGGLTLDVLEAHPHGVDLGPLQPRLPDVLRTTSGKIELTPAPILADLPRLTAALDRESRPGPAGGSGLAAQLIGRRDLRSNNSWMHNLPSLVKGKDRCSLLIHPHDAQQIGLGTDGALACVESRTGVIHVAVEITERIMPGVVSLPHGWGHALTGMQINVATQHAGVNTNILADETLIDPLSGNAILNGIPVTIRPV